MPRNSTSPLDRARIQAALAAARELARLQVDADERIDIFAIIERAGLWLMIQPLKNLYGAYERVGAAAGIIINANHPLGLQRFTAAHEYGHHVLGHESSLDDAARIEWAGRQDSLTEAAAHVFAAHILMPPRLVNGALRRLGVPPKPGELPPHVAYRLALEFGVSYAAVVTHLATLGVISRSAATALRRQEPKDIKADIGRGQRPANAWADTWTVEGSDAGRILYPRVDDELHISLPDASSTGYLWTLSGAPVVDARDGASAVDGGGRGEGAAVALLDEVFEPRSAPGQTGDALRLGGGGVRHFTLRVLHSGRHELRFVKGRPWRPATAPLETFTVTLDVPQVGERGLPQGLSERQKPLTALVA